MPDMRRADALQLFIDLSGRLGEQHPSIEEYTGFRLWNFPEVIKEALMNPDNQDMGVEDKMVEALSVLIGLPQEKITIDDAATERQGKLLDKFALQLAAYMLAAAQQGHATAVLPIQSAWKLTTAMKLLQDYSRETDGCLPAKVMETMGSLGG